MPSTSRMAQPLYQLLTSRPCSNFSLFLRPWRKSEALASCFFWDLNGRGERIRTSDPLVPKRKRMF